MCQCVSAFFIKYRVFNVIHISIFSQDIIITAGGENIPTPLIEETIKSELPVISQAVLIGDARKYLTVLITLKVSQYNIL